MSRKRFQISALCVTMLAWSTGSQIHFAFIFRERYYNFTLHPVLSGTASVSVFEIASECLGSISATSE